MEMYYDESRHEKIPGIGDARYIQGKFPLIVYKDCIISPTTGEKWIWSTKIDFLNYQGELSPTLALESMIISGYQLRGKLSMRQVYRLIEFWVRVISKVPCIFLAKKKDESVVFLTGRNAWSLLAPLTSRVKWAYDSFLDRYQLTSHNWGVMDQVVAQWAEKKEYHVLWYSIGDHVPVGSGCNRDRNRIARTKRREMLSRLQGEERRVYQKTGQAPEGLQIVNKAKPEEYQRKVRKKTYEVK